MRIKPRIRILLLGPIPPPFMGPSVATEVILNSRLREEFQLIHLDTSDHRDLTKLGAIDFQNVYLALKHYLGLVWLVITRWPHVVYVPLSQTTVGYFRDAGFILISKIFGRRVVCHLRGGNFKNWVDSASSMTRWVVRVVHSLVDRQIVLCERLKHLFSEIMPAEKICVVSNGRNFQIGWPVVNGNRRTRILFMANFIREKGVMDTLEAIPDVCSRYPEVEFVFSGAWVEEGTKREFETFLKNFPQLPISIKGTVSGKEKSALLGSSDIFVFPSYYSAEGQPWVIVEAMAHGLPIISTDHGCIRDSVIDGFNGFLVQKRSPHDIAKKMDLLLEDNKLRLAMSENSRKHYETHFTEQELVKDLSDCFNLALGSRH